MSYWVLPASSIPITRTTVKWVTNLEYQTEQCSRILYVYNKLLAERFNEKFISANEEEHKRNKPVIKLWKDLAGNDEVFQEELAQVITNGDTPEYENKFNPETLDNYVNMELSLDRKSKGPKFATVRKKLKDKEGHPIGIASDNPILDTRIYEV